MKLLAFSLCLFVLASLLGKGLIEAQISAGTNKEQLIVSGQVCKSHDDCKSNAANNGRHFCIKDGGGSETGHCVGFDPAIETELKKKKKKKPKKGGCGKCESDDDCKGCPAAAACEKIILNGFCA
ncbi:unnamed protein product [Cuscuta epithymum]|uniref:Uncharacterized protein n=1 Tax=Cuscuta epithymum TaxID=186058 RepID=A0AAV0ENR7_9ASTE|nr:unnamed protein product [Cuscuta epithymum]CAH9125208.1 unnamed protein product [Cuscuta epithymum]